MSEKTYSVKPNGSEYVLIYDQKGTIISVPELNLKVGTKLKHVTWKDGVVSYFGKEYAQVMWRADDGSYFSGTEFFSTIERDLKKGDLKIVSNGWIDKKESYQQLLGLPSGEIFDIPKKGINILKQRGMISFRNYIGGEKIDSYTYNDIDHDKIITILSSFLRDDDW